MFSFQFQKKRKKEKNLFSHNSQIFTSSPHLLPPTSKLHQTPTMSGKGAKGLAGKGLSSGKGAKVRANAVQ